MDPQQQLDVLVADYFDQPLHMRKRDLAQINRLRVELGLPEVDDKLQVPEAVEEVSAPAPKAAPDHREAAALYTRYTAHQAELQRQIDHGNDLIKRLASGGQTPVEPLARGGVNGGPLLCDLCEKPFPLEGGGFQGVAAHEAWAKKTLPTASWRSYISGGLMTMQTTNGTARFYHGYEHLSGCCYSRAMREDDEARKVHNAEKPDTSREAKRLREYFADTRPDLDPEARSLLAHRVVDALFGYDPGVGVNRLP